MDYPDHQTQRMHRLAFSGYALLKLLIHSHPFNLTDAIPPEPASLQKGATPNIHSSLHSYN